MQTLSIEAATPKLAMLLQLAIDGEEIVVTDHERPVARITPVWEPEAYRQHVRSLKGMAEGLDTELERDDDRL